MTCPELLTYWGGSGGFRAQREFEGYSSIHLNMNLPRIEPFELAAWKLTDDISTDADVLMLVSWAQGVTAGVIKKRPLHRDSYSVDLMAGLTKFHASPWVAFGLAAPFMRATGVAFPGIGYIDSCERLEYLLRNVHQASMTELAIIMRSQEYTKAYTKARRVRHTARPSFMNPPGAWYADGTPRPFGDHFRRSGVRVGKEEAKRKATNRKIAKTKRLKKALKTDDERQKLQDEIDARNRRSKSRKLQFQRNAAIRRGEDPDIHYPLPAYTKELP